MTHKEADTMEADTMEADAMEMETGKIKVSKVVFGPEVHPWGRKNIVPIDPYLGNKVNNNELVTKEDIFKIGGFPLYYKDFFRAKTKDVCGYIKGGYIFFFSSVCKQIYYERIAFQKENCYSEGKLRDSIVSNLKNKYIVEVELAVTFGKIDILARNDTETLLIEVKKNPDNQAILKALGQLLAYSHDFPTAQLIFYSNSNLPVEYKRLFSRFSISTRSVSK
jgi:hypothetical protein